MRPVLHGTELTVYRRLIASNFDSHTAAQDEDCKCEPLRSATVIQPVHLLTRTARLRQVYHSKANSYTSLYTSLDILVS